MEPVLVIDVNIDEIYEVNGHAGKACMILFSGSSSCANFKGKILPGGVDTQTEMTDEKRMLSARYILEGEDYTGEKCRIFIENNGEAKEGKTKPLIYTDSESLGWLETADIYGTIQGRKKGVIISFYKG